MKISILLGRGIEGCGVTRYALESKKWHESQGHTVHIHAATDKTWGRKKAQAGEFIEFKNDEIPELALKINEEYDLVYYQSLPSLSHSEEYQDLFLEHLVMKVKNPIKIISQHDHKNRSILRNSNIFEISKQMDAAFVHSQHAPFVKMLKDREINMPILKMGVGFDFDALLPYWKPVDEMINKITYFGRFATFKQPKRMYEMHPLTQKANIYNECLGIERSLGSLKFFNTTPNDNSTQREMIRLVKKTEVIEQKDKTVDKVYVYGPYERESGLETLSMSTFGSDFYRLAEKAYGDNYEYSMCEIIGVGSIPVFDHHWAKHNKSIDGRKYIDIKDFAIYYDEDNPQAAIDEMVSLINDPIAFDKRRKSCFEIAKANTGKDIVFEKQWEQVLTVEKIDKPEYFKQGNTLF